MQFKSRIKQFITLTALLVTAVVAQAQAPAFTVRAPGQVVQGNRFTVTFAVVNANAQVTKGPELKGCTLLYGPATSTMESYEFVNGRQSSTRRVEYTFTYNADKAGTVTVPSLSITVDGKTLKTQQKTITILPPDKSSQQQAGQPAPSQGRVTGGTNINPKDLIVTTTLSKTHIYEQEAVIATIKVYTKHNITSFRATTLPSFDGFLSEELPVSEEAKIEHFRGENYYSAVLKRCLLYPQKDGKLTINSGRYDVTLETYEEISNGFFITRRPVQKNVTTVSNSVSVNVSPLPEPQPAGFDGAVGKFTASTTFEPSLLRTNEAATLTLTVRGTGNIKYLKAPELDLGPSVEMYTPETEANANFNGSDMSGTFTATYTLVPQQVGQLEIPASTFVYFNPATGKYVTIDLPAYSRKVIKGSEAPAAVTAQTKVSKGLDDILHIKNLSGQQLQAEHYRDVNTLLYWACYALVFIALITALIVYRRQLKLNADVAGRRTARANRVANKRLRIARAHMLKHQNEDFYAALASALWGYISDKLNIPASELTRDNISERLTEAGASPELVDQTIHVLDECEMARFTPQHSDQDVSTLYGDAVSVINGLEATKRK